MDFLTHSTILAAGAVALITQILKLKIVPLAFANKYPVPTNIILSILAAVFMVHFHWSLKNIGGDAAEVGTIAVIAALTYNQLLGKWNELKALEG